MTKNVENRIYGDDVKEGIYQNCKFYERRNRGSCVSVWPYKSYNHN